MRFSFRFLGLLLAVLLAWPASLSSYAQRTSIPFNVLLLIDQSYFYDEGLYCRIDVDDQQKILLKVNNQDGKRRGGAWFYKGELVDVRVGNKREQTYCAYSKTIEAEEQGDVDLFLHGEFLDTINPQSIPGDEFLQLVVGLDGLVSLDVVDRVEAEKVGIELPAALEQQATNGDSESSSEVIRRPRTSESEGVTRTERTSGTSRSDRNTTETRQTSGIVAGEWQLEGDSSFDILYVTINEDPNGRGIDYVEDIDPLDFAIEAGMQLIGEGDAPSGCRLFAYSGPMGISVFLGFCADGEYLLTAMSSSKPELDDVLFDFSQDRPFEIPFGYRRSN